MTTDGEALATRGPVGPVEPAYPALAELTDAALDTAYADALGDYRDAVRFLGAVRAERAARGVAR